MREPPLLSAPSPHLTGCMKPPVSRFQQLQQGMQQQQHHHNLTQQQQQQAGMATIKQESGEMGVMSPPGIQQTHLQQQQQQQPHNIFVDSTSFNRLTPPALGSGGGGSAHMDPAKMQEELGNGTFELFPLSLSSLDNTCNRVLD